MKVKYDADVDALTITLREERVRESDELRPGVIVDYSFDDAMVGIEILDASKLVQNAREVEFTVSE